jgi:hypothetical protein
LSRCSWNRVSWGECFPAEDFIFAPSKLFASAVRPNSLG